GAGLFAPAGSALADAAAAAGLRVWCEAFADRAYGADGRLVPRGEPGAVLGEDAALSQALDIVTDERVRCVTGEWIPMAADTLCVHGDGPAAAGLLKGLRAALGERGVEVRAVSA
ncbi:MAG: LamB/YcsF family protein, partial [Verrucomicrobiota bacterium]